MRGFLSYLLLFCMVSCRPSFTAKPLTYLTDVAALSTWLVHAVAGPSRYSLYTVWQPFYGGGTFVALQAVAWSFFGLVFLMTLSMLQIGTRA